MSSLNKKMILNTLTAKKEDDPPWMTVTSHPKKPMHGSGLKVAAGLKMESNPVSFNKKANPPPKSSAVTKQQIPVLAPEVAVGAREEEPLPAFSRKAKPRELSLDHELLPLILHGPL